MIELKKTDLVFKFPEIHPDAELSITFERTLRIPDDGQTYLLPPGLGSFPLYHVDDFARTVPSHWITHGGLMLPMHQSEAMWINFHSKYLEEHATGYRFAVKIASGKINVITGESWQNQLSQEDQDYIVVPEQPWIDGYCTQKGSVRQFVAMPLGSGHSPEEQITGHAEYGGLQIIVYPMKRDLFEDWFPKINKQDLPWLDDICPCLAPDMGLAQGGSIAQDIYIDPYGLTAWDHNISSRCFVHIANSMTWQQITGSNPPESPPTVEEYLKAELPWFYWYDEKNNTLEGSQILATKKTI